MSRLTDVILAVGRVLDRAFGWETPPPRLTEAEVLQTARAVAEGQGWPWSEPVWVAFTPGGRRGGGGWRIMTNASGMGGNVNIVISDDTGAVLQKGFAPY